MVVTKIMVGMVVETRRRTVHVDRGLDVPGRCLVENASVMVLALIAGGGAGMLMVWQERLRVVLLDETRGRTCSARSAVGLEPVELMESCGCKVAHLVLVLFLLVCMDSPGMLTEIVETRKPFSAVKGEGPLKKRAADLMCLARCFDLL